MFVGKKTEESGTWRKSEKDKWRLKKSGRNENLEMNVRVSVNDTKRCGWEGVCGGMKSGNISAWKGNKEKGRAESYRQGRKRHNMWKWQNESSDSQQWQMSTVNHPTLQTEVLHNSRKAQWLKNKQTKKKKCGGGWWRTKRVRERS